LVLVTVESVVHGSFFDDAHTAAGVIPSFQIDAIACVPSGCWPMDISGHIDLDAVRAYQQAARTSEGFARYLQQHVWQQQEAA
jgi:glutaconate CoA-transferase, subunit A